MELLQGKQIQLATLFFVEMKYTAMAVCSIATFSAIQEGYYIREGREIV